MDINDDEAPPLLVEASQAGNAEMDENLTAEVDDLSLVKVPITIVTGMLNHRLLLLGFNKVKNRASQTLPLRILAFHTKPSMIQVARFSRPTRQSGTRLFLTISPRLTHIKCRLPRSWQDHAAQLHPQRTPRQENCRDLEWRVYPWSSSCVSIANNSLRVWQL